MKAQKDKRNECVRRANDSTPRLRACAEEKLRALEAEDPSTLSLEEARRLLHEVQVHQIELEMQNEELRRTRQELEASRARYFDLYDLAPVGYVTLNEQSLILEANLTAATMQGMARGALVKQRLPLFILPEDQDIFRRFRQNLLDSGQPQACELRMVRHGGTSFWAQLDATITRDKQGSLPVCCLTISDITACKQTEEKLRVRESLLHAVFENAPFEFWVRDRNEVGIMENSPVVAHWGSVLGKRPGDSALSPEALAIWRSNNRRAFAGEVVRGEIELHESNGRRWMYNLIAPFRVNGEIQGIVGFNLDITERKRAEEAAREQLTQIEAIYQAAPVGLCLLDANFRYLRVNERLAQMNGLPAEDHIGRTVREAVPHLADHAEAICRRVIATGQPVLDVEMTGKTAAHTGVVRSWISHWTPVKHSDGRTVGVNVVVEETTERKRAAEEIHQLNATLEQRVRERTAQLEAANQELRASQARYRELVENQGEGMVIGDLEERFTFANPASEEIFGVPPGGLVGRSLKEFLTHDQYARVLEETRNRRTGKKSTYELEIVRPDGETRCLLITAAPRKDKAGQYLGAFGLFRDITKRRQAEEQLRKLSRAVEQSPASVVITDLQGKIEYVNAKFIEITGYSLDEVRGQNPCLLKSGATPPEEYARLWQTITSGGQWHGEFHNKKKNGELFWEAALISPILDEAGRATHFLGVKEDITERKRTEAALREQDTLLRSYFDSPGVACGIAELTEEGIRILSANGVLAAAYGRSAEAMQSARASDLGAPQELIEQWTAAIRQSLESGLPVSFEYSSDFRARGTWGLATVCGLGSAPSGVPRFAFLTLDITERKNAEIQLRAQRDLATALSAAHDLKAALGEILEVLKYIPGVDCCGIYLEDPETGGYRLRNHAGLSPTFVERTAWHRADSAEVKLLQQGMPAYVLPNPIGNPLIPLLDREGIKGLGLVPLFHEGRLIGVLALGSHSHHELPSRCRALTESLAGQAVSAIVRIKIQEKLLASEERFRTLFESAPIGMAVRGPNLRFLQINQAYSQMLGYARDELLCLDPERVTHPGDVAETYRHYQELRDGQRDRYVQEKRYVRKDGRIVWVRSVNSAVRSAAGEFDYIISVVEDITAQKRLAESTAAFARLGLELSGATTPSETARIIMDTASSLFGWDACFVHLCSPEQDKTLPLLTMDTIDGGRMDVPLEASVKVRTPFVADVIKRGARLINRDGAASTGAASVPLIPFGDTSRLSASIMCVPIRHSSKIVGVLSIQSYTPQAYGQEDLVLLQVLADHCGSALERVRTTDLLRRLEEEVVGISTREQQRIGFELHDGLGQTLGGISLKAKLLEQTLQEDQLPYAPQAAALVKLLNKAMGDTRRLARSLAPTELELSGLPVAIERMSNEIEASAKIQCLFTCHPPDLQLHSVAALHLYRIVQEALHNAVQHGHPRQIQIALTIEHPRLCLLVRDDGKGFTPDAQGRSGMGLGIMRYRTDAIGGKLTIRSQPNQGTEIRCVLPDVTKWKVESQTEKPQHETNPPISSPQDPHPGGG